MMLVLVKKKMVPSTMRALNFEFYDVLNNSIIQVILGILIMVILWNLSFYFFEKLSFVTSRDFKKIGTTNPNICLCSMSA